MTKGKKRCNGLLKDVPGADNSNGGAPLKKCVECNEIARTYDVYCNLYRFMPQERITPSKTKRNINY